MRGRAVWMSQCSWVYLLCWASVFQFGGPLPVAAASPPVEPWRQTACMQVGDSDQAVLTISFENPSVEGVTRQLRLTKTEVMAKTELGSVTASWRKTGAINIRGPGPDFVVRMDLPPNVLPAGDFGVIDPKCMETLHDYMADIFRRMDKGIL